MLAARSGQGGTEEGGAVVQFNVECGETVEGQQVFACEPHELGNLNGGDALNLANAVPLRTSSEVYPKWTSEPVVLKTVPQTGHFKYKYYKYDPNTEGHTWETTYGAVRQHRTMPVKMGHKTTQHDVWEVVQAKSTTYDELVRAVPKRAIEDDNESEGPKKRGRFEDEVAVAAAAVQTDTDHQASAHGIQAHEEAGVEEEEHWSLVLGPGAELDGEGGGDDQAEAEEASREGGGEGEGDEEEQNEIIEGWFNLRGEMREDGLLRGEGKGEEVLIGEPSVSYGLGMINLPPSEAAHSSTPSWRWQGQKPTRRGWSCSWGWSGRRRGAPL
ncbi:unnamed protein product [Vitrella brassicaformis CCMP3155]|uniref:CBM20 domain-containing protein n=1 Tax=Vitrella brassicaformis (strain CCMP3155) TaxID=1169540 RepID=A0A0G4EA35_VITBC|nr:unnamed protein product [Vitrella brassicaformis CCMP3155]|eukprot:CEL92807.1 unnamed protein product [Vitrella brassicaformis CCMP3155]